MSTILPDWRCTVCKRKVNPSQPVDFDRNSRTASLQAQCAYCEKIVPIYDKNIRFSNWGKNERTT